MKICISAVNNNLDSTLDPRFGRAAYFLIVDDAGKLIKAVKNTGVQAMRGAGVTAAQIVVNENVDILITGNIGPNASMVLGSSGVKIFLGNPAISVRDVLKEHQEGKLQESTGTVHSRSNFGTQLGQNKKHLGDKGETKR